MQDSVEDLRSGRYNQWKAVRAGDHLLASRARISSTPWTAFGRPFRSSRLPSLQRSISSVVLDQTTTIRASVRDVEQTLLISIGLVILVVFIFLRNVRATFIPSVVVPVSLIGTFGVMYLCGYSLDNLSLMALTISTGFVVDDAIVVIENVTRHLEEGMRPMEAALKGAQEIGFTVLSISISLVAVFIPILLMGGIVGRLFREFAVTLSTAIVVSLVVSLTTTPMMCARLLKHQREEDTADSIGRARKFSLGYCALYEHSLAMGPAPPGHDAGCSPAHDRRECLSLHHRAERIFSAAGHRAHHRRHSGRPDTSRFRRCGKGLTRFVDIVRADPAVANVTAFTGGGGGTTTNTGRVFISLEAARGAQRQRRPNHQSLAAETGDGAGSGALSAGGRRTCASEAGRATRNINTRFRATISTT